MGLFRSKPPLHTWHPHEALYPVSMMRTARLVAVVPYVAGVLGVVLCLVLLFRESTSTHTLQPATAFYVLPLFITAIVGWLAYLRLRRRAMKFDHALCIRCGHVLDATRPEGQCPGCGAAYITSRVQWAWKRACEMPTSIHPPDNPDPERFPEATPTRRHDRWMPDRFGHVHLPRAFRRSTLAWGLSLIAVLATLDIGIAVLSHVLELSPHTGALWLMRWSLIYLFLLTCSIVLMSVLLVRWKRRVRNLDGDLCLACGQHLQGLPDEAQCPECGQPFNREANKSIWAAFIQSTTPWFLRFRKNV